MRIQLHSSSQSRQLPYDHIAPDRYIDPNCCTLDDAVQQLAINDQADIPFIVWQVENPHRLIALPDKISLYGHNSLHTILNRGHSLTDVVFVGGFTMGNTTQANWIIKLIWALIKIVPFHKSGSSLALHQPFNAL